MRYLGSKKRISKTIVEVMQANTRPPTQWFVEPFTGSAAVAERVLGLRLLADANPYTIALHQAVQKGWKPPTEVSREFYLKVKNDKANYLPELVGFLMFGCSFGGKPFAGYAKDSAGINYAAQASSSTGLTGQHWQGRNYAAEASSSLIKARPLLQGVIFKLSDYQKLEVPTESLIYCDPPYQGTVGYGVAFDSKEFFARCRTWAEEGHKVYVSEYTAPEDFEVVWEKQVSCTLHKAAASRVERLFRVRS